MALVGLKGGGYVTYKRMEDVGVTPSDVTGKDDLSSMTWEQLKTYQKKVYQDYLTAAQRKDIPPEEMMKERESHNLILKRIQIEAGRRGQLKN